MIAVVRKIVSARSEHANLQGTIQMIDIHDIIKLAFIGAFFIAQK